MFGYCHSMLLAVVCSQLSVTPVYCDKTTDYLLPQPLEGIEQVHNCKSLGIFISSSVSANRHVDYILQLVSQRLYLLNKLRHAVLDFNYLSITLQAIAVSHSFTKTWLLSVSWTGPPPSSCSINSSRFKAVPINRCLFSFVWLCEIS